MDGGRLRETILKTQREFGATSAQEKYREERNQSNGIVAAIEGERARKQAVVQDPEMRPKVGQELQDLADAARVVYDRAIESVRI